MSYALEVISLWAKLGVLTLGSLFAGQEEAEHKSVLIVAYHRVGSNTGTAIDVPLSNFRDQISYLCDHYRVLSLSDAVREAPRSTSNIAVITFDDGYFDFYRNALPHLLKHSAPSTVYLATGYHECSLFPWDSRFWDWPAIRPMRWNEIVEVSAIPEVTLGSHGHRHRPLEGLSGDELAYEVEQSERLFQRYLNRGAEHLSCPFGMLGPATPDLLKQKYQTVCVNGWCNNDPNNLNVHRLTRVPIVPMDDLGVFRQMITGRFKFIESLSNIRRGITSKTTPATPQPS